MSRRSSKPPEGEWRPWFKYHPPRKRSDGRLKLEAAKEGWKAFVETADTFFSEEPPHVRSTYEQTLRHELDADPLPQAWAPAISHIVQDLRTSLDYVANELVLKNTPDADPRKTMFPIATSPKDWKNQSRWIKGASDEAIEFIRQCQPFVESEPEPDRHPLSAINELAAMDRHRIPLLTLAAGAGVEVRFDATKLKGNLALNNDWGRRYMTEAHVSAPGKGMMSRSAEGVVTDEYSVEQLSFRIALNERAGFYEGWDVIETIQGVGDYITAIFPKLEEHLAAE